MWRDEEALAARLRFLIAAHELERVVLIAHQDCGFYRRRLGLVPIELEPQQRGDLEQAARRLQAFGALRVDAFFARTRSAGAFASSRSSRSPSACGRRCAVARPAAR
ncbi:MAG: hypothetical protein U1E76_03135 [Planctomycetota bacterium]